MRAALENAADDEEALSALLAMGRARAEKWERCCVPWLEYRARVAAGRAGRGEAAVAELIREWEEVE
jgi:hypothetical protein